MPRLNRQQVEEELIAAEDDSWDVFFQETEDLYMGYDPEEIEDIGKRRPLTVDFITGVKLK